VLSSINYGLGCLKEFQIFCNQSNSQFYSWLTTAHAVPSPSPWIEISLTSLKGRGGGEKRGGGAIGIS
jgi:hypothetical protein